MEKYYRKEVDEDDFDTKRFSAFAELQKTGMKESITAAGFTYKDFAVWVHEKLIYPISTVRKLPLILKNEKAKRIFLKKGTEEALKLIWLPICKIISYNLFR